MTYRIVETSALKRRTILAKEIPVEELAKAMVEGVEKNSKPREGWILTVEQEHTYAIVEVLQSGVKETLWVDIATKAEAQDKIADMDRAGRRTLWVEERPA